MTELTTLIATVAGGGGALTIIAGGLLWLTKESIGKAIQQAGASEIERLRGQLAQELEKERQTFAREVQRETTAAAMALEQFKAQLTLEAEVRRHAAARKVEALLKVARVSDTIIGRTYGGGRDRDFSDNIKAADEYLLACRETEALLAPESTAALESFGALLQHTMTQVSQPGANLMEIWGAAENARRQMLAVVRRELQLEQGARSL